MNPEESDGQVELEPGDVDDEIVVAAKLLAAEAERELDSGV